MGQHEESCQSSLERTWNGHRQHAKCTNSTERQSSGASRICAHFGRLCAGRSIHCGFNPPRSTRGPRKFNRARRQKAADTTLEEVSGTEKALNAIKDKKLLERFATGIAGFRLRFGGLATGQGFAVGPEYLRQDLAHGNLIFRGSARASLAKAQLYDLQLTLPNLAHETLFVDLYAVHRNLPRIDYFGPGPDSEERRAHQLPARRHGLRLDRRS